MSARRLLTVDLDGTLLDRSGRPHARDLQAIRAALAAGVQVTIATGRLYSGTRAVVELLGLRGAVACADGSHLVRSRDHATLVHLGVCGNEAVLLRGALAEARLTTFVFARDAIGHDVTGAPFIRYVSTWSNDVREAPDVFEHDLWNSDGGVTAVVGIGTRQQVAQVKQNLSRDLAHSVLLAAFPVMRGGYLDTWAIIVRAAGGTKGTAMRWIAEHEGIALENTVCVGDWINDVPMFDVAGRSFAMGQAPDEVKSRATDVLVETAEEGGGVARAIAEAFEIAVD